ncbi:DNA translocase FtsK [Alkalihalophilus marmarensis]|uniref:DNA translocase FtsK n=1 Tax=Alkalihalophilus marmarensis TaxID=521377 RepID=UPI002E2389F5|nr:DNA translocase FtsK [Alkalihalophilus marmarensis]
MDTLKQWIKKIQGALSGGEESDNTSIKSHKQTTEDHPPQAAHNSKRSFGYIESGQRESEPRMVYQYPKPGKFRFPLIEDENQERKRSVSETENSPRKTFRQAEQEQPENKRTRRTERVSQERDKPSQIKVDKKIEEKAMERTQGNSQGNTQGYTPSFPQSKKEFKPTSIPSPVYGFKERKKNMLEDESLLSSLPGYGKVIEPKRPSVTMEKQLEVFLKAENLRNSQVAATVLDQIAEKSSESTTQDDSAIEKSTILDSIPEKVDVHVRNDLLSIEDDDAETVNEAITQTVNEPVDEQIPEHNLQSDPSDVQKTATDFKEDLPHVEEKPVGSPFQETVEPASVVETIEEDKDDEAEEFKTDTADEVISSSQVTERVEQNEVSYENVPNQIETIQTGESIQNSLDEEIVVEEKTEVKSDQAAARSKPKESIPFNVMMLPQDKKPKKVQPQQVTVQSEYNHPSIQLLKYPQHQEEQDSEWLQEQAEILEETLLSFNVDAKVVNVTKGPSVTRYEIQPARGVKVNKVTSLTDDMKLALAAKDIRIEAPIPGKNTIGIEVPNKVSKPVFLREILRRDVFIKPESPLTVALGLDISGQPIVTDLRKMPHGLVAGATGSGKSVCINSVLISLLYKANPDEVKLLLIDPKMVELAPYNKLPHLVTPVITDAKQATAALKWVVGEMERRYELFSQQGVRDVTRYNELYSESKDKPALPYMIVVIDELADLMMVSPQDVEDSICRIAQKARACGIHLLLATQRPSVDVITGLIKANIPTRIAFSVSSQTDSRTILDMSGAERLLGRGDMLFHENGAPKPVRVQGTFVSDEEIEDVLAFVKKQREPEYLFAPEQLKKMQSSAEQDDDLLEEACYFVIQQGGASASSLQRRFRVGYNRAARLIDMMEDMGVISEAMGSKPRHILVDEIELEERLYPNR